MTKITREAFIAAGAIDLGEVDRTIERIKEALGRVDDEMIERYGDKDLTAEEACAILLSLSEEGEST